MYTLTSYQHRFHYATQKKILLLLKSIHNADQAPITGATIVDISFIRCCFHNCLKGARVFNYRVWCDLFFSCWADHWRWVVELCFLGWLFWTLAKLHIYLLLRISSSLSYTLMSLRKVFSSIYWVPRCLKMCQTLLYLLPLLWYYKALCLCSFKIKFRIREQ